MSTSQSEDKNPKFKMHLSDSIVHDQTEQGEEVRQMLSDISQGLGEILGPGYMSVAVGGSPSNAKTDREMKEGEHKPLADKDDLNDNV